MGKAFETDRVHFEYLKDSVGYFFFSVKKLNICLFFNTNYKNTIIPLLFLPLQTSNLKTANSPNGYT